MRKKFYPSQRKSKLQQYNQIISSQMPSELDLNPPVRFSDEKATAVFENWKNRFLDGWSNSIANINANNSLSQYNEYLLNRL